MKRLLLAALFVALLGCGYYLRSYVFDTASETRPARPPAPGQQVVADVAVEMPALIQVTAIGTVQSIATVMMYICTACHFCFDRERYDRIRYGCHYRINHKPGYPKERYCRG
jgi:hypothetical protein